MTEQLMLSQVRLVYEYLCDEVTRCKNGSAPLCQTSQQHVLETARNGLFMIIRATIGDGYDEAPQSEGEAVGSENVFAEDCEVPCEKSDADVPGGTYDDEPAVEKESNQ